ncbi:MAG: 50S ribosomal protein L9 [Candidatus Doudnabacteria bacterium RIFCSPHIGHO2_02_FULL_46_11]|uniref:Large ribosomal subunit protein bL9 n=1 Tax=Candidatus Doudnabacteria bacterium RIFCSPHIGHO2_02_FULL_46_11 TaxID=1817832 RepID=A0A1F5P9V4_9BACT|nr:MAG: 50S ribosomal protein L9 [Candidatus Doudnabacteria bacterium RIFCSPHIGHO2_02_FULL_46_11]
MKVILTKDIKSIGRKNDVKDVSEGYARNFLFPKGLAEQATASRLNEIEQAEKRRLSERDKHEQQFKKLGGKLKDITLSFARKGDKSGTIFGSISAHDIAQALKEKTQLEVSAKQVELPHALKKAGEHLVGLNLGPGLRPTLKVKIEIV